MGRVEDVLETVVFQVETCRYGVPARDVRELLRAVAVTPLPRAPSSVEGIINLRGRLVPILDLRGRFGHPPREILLSDHLVVASAGKRRVAFRVDRCLGLVTIPADVIEDVRGSVPRAGYVSGAAKLPDGIVLIHDLSTFLSGTEEEQLSHALDSCAGTEASS